MSSKRTREQGPYLMADQHLGRQTLVVTLSVCS